MPVFIVIVLCLAALIIMISRKPNKFSVTRTALINAPAELVFDQVNDLHRWEGWSPWAKIDPACRNDFSGPASGAGAAMHWSGNNKVGEGRMTITESRVAELVRLRLEFIRPFRAVNETLFTFAPEGPEAGGGTRVSWTMTGENKFINKAMMLVMDCEKMVGGQFDQGLAALKVIAEDSTVTL